MRRAATDTGATPGELGAAQTQTGCVTRRPASSELPRAEDGGCAASCTQLCSRHRQRKGGSAAISVGGGGNEGIKKSGLSKLSLGTKYDFVSVFQSKFKLEESR